MRRLGAYCSHVQVRKSVRDVERVLDNLLRVRCLLGCIWQHGYLGRQVSYISAKSASRAHWRPSRMAQTTRD